MNLEVQQKNVAHNNVTHQVSYVEFTGISKMRIAAEDCGLCSILLSNQQHDSHSLADFEKDYAPRVMLKNQKQIDKSIQFSILHTQT